MPARSIIAIVLFTLFALLGATVYSETLLFISRFCIGLAIGCSSFVAPLYLSEIAPTSIRGGFIAMYQLMVTIGILGIYVSNYLIEHAYHSWRLMLGVTAIPSIIILFGVIVIPKTPRWLFLKGKKGDAKNVLNKIRDDEKIVANELQEIESSQMGP